jgi:hypothetical protein
MKLPMYRLSTVLILSSLFFSLMQVRAQTDSAGFVELNQFHSKKHEWSFGINIGTGMVRTESFLNAGLVPNYLVRNENFRMNYTYRPGSKWAFDIGMMVGNFPVLFKFEEEEYFLFRYYENMAPIPRFVFDPGIRYLLKESRKTAWELKGSLMLNKLINEKGGLGNSFIGVYGDPVNTRMSYITNPSWMLGGSLGLSYLRKLRNKDAVEMNLSYQHIAADLIRGDYQVFFTGRPGSFGRFYQRANGPVFSLMYTFTGIEKQNLKSTKAFEQPGLTEKQVKSYSDSVLSNNFHRPSWDLGFVSGFTLSRTLVNETTGLMKEANAIGGSYALSFQRNSRKGMLFEFSIAVVPYIFGYKVPLAQSDCFLCGHFSDSFTAFQHSLAIGKKVFNKKAKLLFYAKTGAALSFTDATIGLSGKSVLVLEGPDYLYSNQSNSYQLRKVFPLIFGELGREFRLNPNWLILMAYRYHQGFRALYSSAGYQEMSGQISYFTIDQTGSYHQWLLGLKYRFFKK